MNSSIPEFFKSHNKVVVITGAGVSTASGIPDYRDEFGAWKHKKPMQYQDFVSSRYSRQRYWSGSTYGWLRIKNAMPNRAHTALAHLEEQGKVSLLITQNVDRLHHRAGSRKVIDLHGSLDEVVCLDCFSRYARDDIQQYLLGQNPSLRNLTPTLVPDGDTQLQQIDFSRIDIPGCEACGGVLKPDVVFYGEGVPAERVKACFDALDNADALLVAGSSLMVYSGYRFVRHAFQKGLPIAAINRGITRADDLLSFKVDADCADELNIFIA